VQAVVAAPLALWSRVGDIFVAVLPLDPVTHPPHVYGHVTEQMKREAADKMEGYIQSLKNKTG
jgi:hypothetical protein